MVRPTAKKLTKLLNIDVKHALYDKNGTWYHLLNVFPAALIDKHGYIILKTKNEYKNSKYLSIKKELHIADGIANMPGYIKEGRIAKAIEPINDDTNKLEQDKTYDLYVPENNIDNEIKKIEDRLEKINKTERQSIIKSRIGQSNFKNGLVKKHKKCLLCDIGMPELLIASHIKPWSESNDKEKLDLNNGLLLCCIHDKLFDLGLISFDASGRIIISNQIDEFLYRNLGINKEQHIDVNEKTIKYLNWHKENKLRQKIG
jgi:hypothetical protein